MVSFPPGVQVNEVYTFESKYQIKITKNETEELTYKLALKCLGAGEDGSVEWDLYIEDKPLALSSGDRVTLYGSKEIVLEPSGLDAIRIKETDEEATQESWIDLSGRMCVLSDTPIAVDERIPQLLERAKIFKPSDDKESKKIFFHSRVGVIIYARDDKWNTGIYVAQKEDVNFVEAEAKLLMQCRCPQADSSFEVKLPRDGALHTLSFAQGLRNAANHLTDTQWDGINLREIVL